MLYNPQDSDYKQEPDNKDTSMSDRCLYEVNMRIFAVRGGLINHGVCSFIDHVDGLAQDCGISLVLALDIPQSFTKPSICSIFIVNPSVLEWCVASVP